MNLDRSQKIIIGAVGLLAVVILLMYFRIIPGFQKRTENVSLTIWLPNTENINALEPILDSYESSHSGIRLDYEQISADEYEDRLIDALAAGEGPDIFTVPADSLKSYLNKITPVDEKKFSLARLQTLFPQVVETDFVDETGQIYGLPLSIDTLALYYNKNLFDQKGVALPPQTWKAAKSLSDNGLILPIKGESSSVRNGADILNLMWLQEGVSMVDNSYKSALFDSAKGTQVFNHYLSFPTPTDEAITDFANGKAAMIVDYLSASPLIRQKSTSLNVAIAPAPQFNVDFPVNYANYYGYAVSKKSLVPDAAWDLILFLTTDSGSVSSYLDTAKKVPALRQLIESYKNDPAVGIFAKQVLTSRNWLKPDAGKTDLILNDMIKEVVEETISPAVAIEKAAGKVTDLIK